jgi:hypothetical protein
MQLSAVVAVALLGACKDKPTPPGTNGAGTPKVTASASGAATASASGATTGTTTTSGTAANVPLGDGGSSCRLEVGPIATDFSGPAALAPSAMGVDAIGNDKGSAHFFVVEGKGTSATSLVSTSTVPCAWAKGFTFCPDASGAVHKRDRAGMDEVVAHARSGTRVAAAETSGHAVLAFVADQKTSEGMKQIAQLWADDGHTERLSDEGNGATFVDLAARDGEAVAMFIDAHMGMTPIHARTIQWQGRPVLGADTVLFVAGNAESETRGALATRHDKSPSFGLVPIAKDISAFGVVAIEIARPPKVDASVAWSLYDNGLDPAPIAATHDVARVVVARVRPDGKAATAPRVLELGTLDDAGKYTLFGTVATHGRVSHVALAADATGVWLAYTDEQRTWVERRVCF